MKPFTNLAVLIFALMALVHLYRLVRPFEVIVGGTALPLWVSGVGVAAAGLLAIMVWRESRAGR
jgi:hypothetical protein